MTGRPLVILECRCRDQIGRVVERDGVDTLVAERLASGLVPLPDDRKRGPGPVSDDQVTAAILADKELPIDYEVEQLIAPLVSLEPRFDVWCPTCGPRDVLAAHLRRDAAKARRPGSATVILHLSRLAK